MISCRLDPRRAIDLAPRSASPRFTVNAFAIRPTQPGVLRQDTIDRRPLVIRAASSLGSVTLRRFPLC